jgi:hypothetical protein
MAKVHVILGVHITQRVKTVPEVQRAFTAFGCSIRTRLGLHDVHEGYCSPSGMIVLEMAGPGGEIARFQKKLKAIPGVEVKKMVFKH